MSGSEICEIANHAANCFADPPSEMSPKFRSFGFRDAYPQLLLSSTFVHLGSEIYKKHRKNRFFIFCVCFRLWSRGLELSSFDLEDLPDTRSLDFAFMVFARFLQGMVGLARSKS